MNRLRYFATVGTWYLVAINIGGGATGFVGRAQEIAPERTPAIELARASLKQAHALTGYQAVFTKKERFGRKLSTQRIKVKIRHQPFSVYLHFDRPHQGREVIFVTGRDKDQLLVHETGLASLIGTIRLPPDSDDAMDENHYPITKLGIANMAELLVQQWEAELKSTVATFRQESDTMEGDRKCTMIESVVARSLDPTSFHRTRLWIEDATGLPIKVQRAGFPIVVGGEPPIVEEYHYAELNTTVNLADLDFDTRNPAYNY